MEFKGSLSLDWINKNKSLYYEIDDKDSRGVRPIWVEKNDVRVTEPRPLILKEIYGEENSDNMLIKGDNLLALRRLVQEFNSRDEKDRIKCIYIDPPYNTQNAFEHYDDNLQHSEWLTMMRDRLLLLKRLLRKDGIIMIQVNDDEVDYLKIMMDEIFGRNNFINRIIVETRSPSAFSTVNPGVFKSAEYILWYCRDKEYFESKTMRIKRDTIDTAYNKYILNFGDSCEKWIYIPIKEAFLRFWNEERIQPIRTFINDNYEQLSSLTPKVLQQFFIDKYPYYQLLNLQSVSSSIRNNLKKRNKEEFFEWAFIYLLERSSKVYTEKDYRNFILENAKRVCREAEISDDGAGKDTVELKYKSLQNIGVTLKLKRELHEDQYAHNGKQIIFYSKNVMDINGEKVPTKFLTNVWSDISWEGIAKEGEVELKKGKKPEALLKRIFELTTEEGEFVLDSFAGSGTTAATAHKMGRRWITIEMGKHVETKCLKRLKRVIGNINTDVGNVGKEYNWKGGGGFKYYEVGPSVVDNMDLNWKLDLGTLHKAILEYFGYNSIEKYNNFFIGKLNEENKSKIGISSISKEIEMIDETEFEEIIQYINKKYNLIKIEFYTNKGIEIQEDSLDSLISIHKLPNCILD
ncbi:adenine-specific DNA-methyltransferase [Clostridium neonatale]|uniref:site-specific DNA-methyltransferase n=1 Tax=Clostridium neonatale TaxID=137838 RepID=UPI00291C1807|nr:site-specific DNA-methyltransferase [Clostridium neonatale]CAI3238752.1 adenine-specific DNA-methyltransferase [Clostridium neonatale]CAI3539814.1 adenine-specific DNA-methyltransferase [Clostridium neonatale]